MYFSLSFSLSQTQVWFHAVQVIYVYEPKYESAASFWPSIHRNVIIGLIINHITLIGLFSVKKAFASTPFLVPLPVLTIMFHLFCTQKFYPSFKNYPLQVPSLTEPLSPLICRMCEDQNWSCGKCHIIDLFLKFNTNADLQLRRHKKISNTFLWKFSLNSSLQEQPL